MLTNTRMRRNRFKQAKQQSVKNNSTPSKARQ